MNFEIAIPELGDAGKPEVVIELNRARETTVRFTAADGYPLEGTLFAPANGNGVSALVNSAYAVPRGFYAPYAQYLAGLGFTVLTYDYRGIGDSVARNWRSEPPRMRHWGERDLVAALDWLRAQRPSNRLVAVGHSAGGQMVGLAANNEHLDAMLTVSSQSGYWRLFDYPYDLLAFAWFYAVVPAMAYLGGLFPRLRRGGFAAPRGVALEWARWGRNPHYISDDASRPMREHFERYSGSIRLIHISDDHEFAPRRTVEALAGFYRKAQTEVVRRAPSDYGLDRIGHFGFFRSSMPRAAWQETAQWLLSSARRPDRVAA